METIHNFRDFGGFKTQNGLVVKRGTLYRSGSLDKASDEDLKALSALGIRTICDLRTPQERSDRPDRRLGGSEVKIVHIPVKSRNHNESGFISQLFSLLFGKARGSNFDQVSREIYREYVTVFRHEFSEVVKLAVESNNLPILIHCTAGKDRSGFACSVIQLLLGMSLELVLQEYLRTNEHLHRFREEMLEKLKLFSVFGVPLQKFQPLFYARREYLEAAWDQMQRDYGSVDEYMRAGLGVADEEASRLKTLLLERP